MMSTFQLSGIPVSRSVEIFMCRARPGVCLAKVNLAFRAFFVLLKLIMIGIIDRQIPLSVSGFRQRLSSQRSFPFNRSELQARSLG